MRYSLSIALALCLASPALAQSQPAGSTLPDPDAMWKRDTLTVGAGAAILPDYQGSDDYRIIPMGAVRGQYHGIAFTTLGSYFYVDFVPQKSKVDFDAGPLIGVRFNRTGHIKDDVVSLLPKRKTAIEVGGFAGLSIHGVTNPYDTIAVQVDVAHDVANAHRSTIVSPNLQFSTPLSRSTFASASLSADFVSDKFADYYFSVTPADSLASGLPAFKAGGGAEDWKLGLLLNQSLSGDLLHGISIFGYGEYSHLLGDFERSPIVSQRGSPGQWLGSVGLAYTW